MNERVKPNEIKASRGPRLWSIIGVIALIAVFAIVTFIMWLPAIVSK